MLILEICSWIALSWLLALIHVYGPTEQTLNFGSTAFFAMMGALIGGGFARMVHFAPLAVRHFSFMQLIFAGLGTEVVILLITGSRRRPSDQPPLAPR